MTEDAGFSAVSGATRQRRIPGGRSRCIDVKVSDEDYVQLASRAAAARLSLPRYLVDTALSDARPASAVFGPLQAEIAGIHRMLGSLGGNINQIARRLNAGYDIDAAQLSAACEAVVRMRARVEVALSWSHRRSASAP